MDSLSFDIYSKRLNLLTNIKWNTVKWLLKKELDAIEEKYEKWRFEIKMIKIWFFLFLLNTLQIIIILIEEHVNNENILKEDKVVTIFKRDRLFWEKWCS